MEFSRLPPSISYYSYASIPQEQSFPTSRAKSFAHSLRNGLSRPHRFPLELRDHALTRNSTAFPFLDRGFAALLRRDRADPVKRGDAFPVAIRAQLFICLHYCELAASRSCRMGLPEIMHRAKPVPAFRRWPTGVEDDSQFLLICGLNLRLYIDEYRHWRRR